MTLYIFKGADTYGRVSHVLESDVVWTPGVINSVLINLSSFEPHLLLLH